MTPLFKLGPGVPVGSGGSFIAQGRQWMSWIHIDDIVGIFRLALDHDGATGPINGTAPEPVRNSEFARTFSSVLRKPYTPWRFYLPFGPPDALVRLVLGDVAEMITTGQRVVPVKALALGYRFKYPSLAEALGAIATQRRAPALSDVQATSTAANVHEPDTH
jgi:NAD dependent epimerase/dehydratase family enzyme